MKLFLSFLAIVLLSFHENVKALDINEKAIPLPFFPSIGEQVWWIQKVTKYEAPEGVTLTDEDKKFCNPLTFFDNCGPMRYKVDDIKGQPVTKLWALNKNDNKIYYWKSNIEKIDDNKAIFRLKVDETGKVAGEGEKPQTVRISKKTKELQEQPHALLYMDPLGRYQIAGDERNAWIQVRDYVVRQHQLEELYNKEIAQIIKDLGIPEDRLVTLDKKFDINVDLLALEGANCKVKALPMPGVPENMKQPSSWWVVRSTRQTPTMANPPGAWTDEDMQTCAPNALFENCGSLRGSTDGSNKVTLSASRKGNDGNSEVLNIKGEIEKIDEQLAIFRLRVNRNANVLSGNGESEPVTLPEGAVDIIEKPYAVVGAGPNNEYLLFSDCEGNNVWATVPQQLVDNNQVENLIPQIEEQLKKFNNLKPLVNLKTEFPINLDLATL